MSIRRRQLEHVVNLLPEPKGHRDGRCVHSDSLLVKLPLMNFPTIKRGMKYKTNGTRGVNGNGTFLY